MSTFSQKVVLLINLGTPNAPTSSAVRHYLAEFLSDPRVVKLPACLWKPILNCFILPLRSRRSAKFYQAVWMKEGSPLAVYTKSLAEKIQKNIGNSIQLVWVMRYGQPSLAVTLRELLSQKAIQSLTLLPLYPQYSSVTTGSCFDVLVKQLKHASVIPSLRFISSYFDHRLYITALAETVQRYWAIHGKAAYLLFSFHGLPQYTIELGDPYEQQCYTTVHLLAQKLHLSAKHYQIVFQSRFGKAAWLQPYCDLTLQQLPSQGVKRVAVMCPGFAVDCLETLEEIAQRYRRLFLKAGGESFHYIPALNDSIAQCELLTSLVQQTTVKH